MNSIINSIKMFFLMTLLTGVLYPLVITAAGQVFFYKEANGSIIYLSKNAVGSELIGQDFTAPKYFHGRPSATGYGTLPSGGSNKSVSNKEFNDFVNKKYSELSVQYNTKDIPQEMYLNSGSGLDPHISQKAALLQAARVAEARKMTAQKRELLKTLIYKLTEKKDMGIFGEERVNVLKLNLAVDRID